MALVVKHLLQSFTDSASLFLWQHDSFVFSWLAMRILDCKLIMLTSDLLVLRSTINPGNWHSNALKFVTSLSLICDHVKKREMHKTVWFANLKRTIKIDFKEIGWKCVEGVSVFHDRDKCRAPPNSFIFHKTWELPEQVSNYFHMKKDPAL